MEGMLSSGSPCTKILVNSEFDIDHVAIRSENITRTDQVPNDVVVFLPHKDILGYYVSSGSDEAFVIKGWDKCKVLLIGDV